MEQHKTPRGRPRDIVRVQEPVLRELLTAVESSHLTDGEIVERAGVYPAALSKLRTGARSSRLVTIASIAGVVGLQLTLEPK